MRFTFRKVKWKPVPTHKQKKSRGVWTIGWKWYSLMNQIFALANAETFVYYCSNEIYKDDCLNTTTKFPKSCMIWGCMSFKGSVEMTIITSTINTHVDTEILDNFHIPKKKNWFDDDEVILQGDNASCHKAKKIRDFLQKRRIKSMAWLANI